MTKQILMIIAPIGFQELEYSVPKRNFLNEGYNVKTASTEKIAQSHMGNEEMVNLDISEVDVNNYDAIIFIGGPGAVNYQQNSIALNICKNAIEKNKLLCAICIAPTILAYAGVLNGKKATVWNGNGEPEKILKENGAEFTDEEVTIDGNIITANGPQSAQKFANEILKKLN